MMDDTFEIVQLEKPDDSVWGVIGGGIHHYNIEKAGDGNGKPVCFVLRDENQEVVGGVVGETHWEWLYINLMFVREDLRGQGHGQRLLTLAEEEGRKQGAKRAYLDTFSFQAPDFYKDHGYAVFGELTDFPAGHSRYYLVKSL